MKLALEIVSSVLPYSLHVPTSFDDAQKDNPFVLRKCAIQIGSIVQFKVRLACASG